MKQDLNFLPPKVSVSSSITNLKLINILFGLVKQYLRSGADPELKFEGGQATENKKRTRVL